jgi:outer membrane protein TolC
MGMSGLGKIRLATLAALAAALVASGCTSFREYVHNGFKVGPNYSKPAAPVADEWIDSNNEGLITGPMETAGWWRAFGDPALDRLINIAYEQNISLREAGFRIAESQAQRAVIAGNLFPQTQQVFGDYNRFQRSTVTATFPRNAVLPPGLIVTNFDNWRLGGAMAWELDFWGRYRRAIESADANLDASVEGYDDALVLLISEVATAYIDYRTVARTAICERQYGEPGGNCVVAQAELDAGHHQRSCRFAASRFKFRRTQAAIQVLEISKRQAQNRLCVMGLPPHDLAYILSGGGNSPAAHDDCGRFASLMRRRPDIRQANGWSRRDRLFIGVAQSNLYPAISINARPSRGWRLTDLFTSDAWAGSVGRRSAGTY